MNQASVVRIRAVRHSARAVAALALLAGCAAPPGPASPGVEGKFSHGARYAGEPGASHDAALDQVARTNVSQLQVAWSYPIGDNSAMGMNPIVIDTMMYVVGKGGSVVALNAATGREL